MHSVHNQIDGLVLVKSYHKGFHIIIINTVPKRSKQTTLNVCVQCLSSPMCVLLFLTHTRTYATSVMRCTLRFHFLWTFCCCLLTGNNNTHAHAHTHTCILRTVEQTLSQLLLHSSFPKMFLIEEPNLWRAGSLMVCMHAR